MGNASISPPDTAHSICHTSVALYVTTCFSAILLTAFLFAVASAGVLNDFVWELSPANWLFSLICGAIFGIPGMDMAMAAHYVAPKNRLLAATLASVGWSIIASVCFYFYVVIFMMG